MPFIPFCKISDDSSREKFSANPYFAATISRNIFKAIRVSVTLHSQFDSQEYCDKSSVDSLYHFR